MKITDNTLNNLIVFSREHKGEERLRYTFSVKLRLNKACEFHVNLRQI